MLFNKKKGGRKLKARHPRTGREDYSFSAPSPEEMASIASELRGHQPAWQAMGVDARIAVLREWAQVVSDNAASIGDALIDDTGRTTIARMEVGGLPATVDRWCNLAPALMETPQRPSQFHETIDLESRFDPYPLVGVISPWNFPLTLSFIDAIPALLAGCAVMIKPSEVTPRFAEPIAETIKAVPALHNVLRILPGDGETGAALVDNVDVVAFTGSVATGRKVGEAAARNFIPAFLELGGKDPAIVRADADIDRASTALLRGSVIATGQACQSIERIYVHSSLFDAFVEKLVAKAEAAPLNTDGKGIIGPLIFGRQAEIIEDHLQDAIAKGASVLCGGKIETHGGGRWVAPTVLTNVTHDMKVMTEETFGPVMPVMAFETDDEAIAFANQTSFGLSGCIFSGDVEAALAMADRIKAGGISINDASLTTMVHEIEKNGYGLSGAGPSRMGPTGLTRFMRQKAIYIQNGPVMPIEAVAEGQ
jgi:acyl-CoA reductase-like NAD-dependent aldehyde dehydrogenase